MNLIYYTVGGYQNYINLLDLSLKSLIKNSSKNFEILIICDDEMKKNIQKKINIDFVLNFHITNSKTMNESSYNKFQVYNFEKIKNYEKIIYCDVDILWRDSPSFIFDKIKDKFIHVSNEEGLMTEEYWGGNLLTNEEKKEIQINNIKGINAGFFGFHSKNSHVFEELNNFMKKNINFMGTCIEQPFFNVFLFRNKFYENNLNEVITHDGYISTIPNKPVIHFAGGPGNYDIKISKMTSFFNKNLL